MPTWNSIRTVRWTIRIDQLKFFYENQHKRRQMTMAPKKTVKKTTSRFYTVRTVQKAKKNLTKAAKDYNKKLFQEPVENGKDFVEELKDNPRKVIESFVDDGKDFIQDFRKDARKKIDDVVKDSKKFFRKVKKNPRKTIDSLFDDGKEFIKDLQTDTRKKIDSFIDDGKDILEGIEKDARLVIDDLVESGKKRLDEIPGKKSIETTIEKKMKSIQNQLNLPSKKEVEKLARNVNALNQKVEIMSSQVAA